MTVETLKFVGVKISVKLYDTYQYNGAGYSPWCRVSNAMLSSHGFGLWVRRNAVHCFLGRGWAPNYSQEYLELLLST